MNIERALATEGWMSGEELAYLASAAIKSEMVLEIGSWLGRSTCALAANTTGTVWAVDTWEGGPQQGDFVQRDQFLNQFLHNVEGLPVIPIALPSKLAVHQLDTLRFDLIFIDAAHDYENVKADITTYLPLLREGGIICGHDYHDNWPGVKQAVIECISSFRVFGTIWTSEAASEY